MKNLVRLFMAAAVTALLFSAMILRCHAQDNDNDNHPGTAQQTDVDRANAKLDQVYRNLLAKAGDDQEKTALREAERAWIKWRDAEVMYIARRGGAVGGSELRVEYAKAELELIDDRVAALKDYASQAPAE